MAIDGDRVGVAGLVLVLALTVGLAGCVLPGDSAGEAGVDRSALANDTDHDGDGLLTGEERDFGTDPTNADSDQDGLPDTTELLDIGTDPLDSDSDSTRTDISEADDDTPDGEEDLDADGITNYEELVNESSPTAVDTDDDDGLDDPTELDLGSDPDNPDTDGDSLADGEERSAGFDADPLTADTDGDGVPDGEETVETTIRNDQTGVSVTVHGSAASAGGVSIAPRPSYFTDVEANVGPAVRITNDTAFERATVRIPIDSSVSDPDDDVAVFRWTGETSDRWSAIESQVSNGTAVATVDSFGYFSVLDRSDWINATAMPVDG